MVLYGNKIRVNVNVWSIKLTVIKYYGKKHIGAMCPRFTVLGLRLIQL